jgi:hypothetical protein
VAWVIGALPVASLAEWLAGIASGENVDRRHFGPVDDLQVAEVRDAEAAVDDPDRVGIDLGAPRHLAAKYG